MITLFSGDMPNIQNMPNLNVINNFKDGKIPEIPPGMKISDLKEAFYNLPPSMKEKLNEMAQCKFSHCVKVFKLRISFH